MTKKNTHQTEHGSDAPVEEKAIIDSTEVETGTAYNQAAELQNGVKNEYTRLSWYDIADKCIGCYKREIQK